MSLVLQLSLWAALFVAYLVAIYLWRTGRVARFTERLSSDPKSTTSERGVSGPVFGSPIEELLFAKITGAGLPIPALQHEYRIKGRLVTVPDFAYPSHRIAIYCDGHEWHSTRDAMTGDSRKRNALQLAGWIVLVFPGREIKRNPSTCIETIRMALVSRGAIPG